MLCSDRNAGFHHGIIVQNVQYWQDVWCLCRFLGRCPLYCQQGIVRYAESLDCQALIGALLSRGKAPILAGVGTGKDAGDMLGTGWIRSVKGGEPEHASAELQMGEILRRLQFVMEPVDIRNAQIRQIFVS